MADIVDTPIKMEARLIKSSQVLTYSTTGNSPGNTCLCCSDTLLRHISLRGMYWRCSHCYQEMPAQKSLQELRFTYGSNLSTYMKLRHLLKGTVEKFYEVDRNDY